jgi:hypothetical protein
MGNSREGGERGEEHGKIVGERVTAGRIVPQNKGGRPCRLLEVAWGYASHARSK